MNIRGLAPIPNRAMVETAFGGKALVDKAIGGKAFGEELFDEDGFESLVVGDDVILDLTVDPPAIELGARRQALDTTPQNRKARTAVRVVDVVGAVILLVLASPVILVLWLTVRLSSPGAGFYRSARVGHGRPDFKALKFRTMVIDAEDRLQAVLAADHVARAHYERYAKLYDDPRVTPIGRVLRRTSLDELPQLWNVLRGDMSLVGPRPWLPSEPARYGAARATVERVKPGLTGLWQVSGRSHLSFDERILLDVEYATSRNTWGDLVILMRTVWHLLRPGSNGAY